MSPTAADEEDAKIFPMRLMEVLQDESNSESIRWLPHGRAFIIYNKKLFEAEVMPKFFPRKSKYSSFTRKLNRWNFMRVSSGPELGAYYHEFFLRDKPRLSAQMFCKNARSKLAMEIEPVTALPQEDPLRRQPVSQVRQPSMAVKPIKSSMPELTPAMVAALVKIQQRPSNFVSPASLHLNQIQMALREQQRLLQQYEAAVNEINMLQQLVGLRMHDSRGMQQRSPPKSSPPNPRASAA